MPCLFYRSHEDLDCLDTWNQSEAHFLAQLWGGSFLGAEIISESRSKLENKYLRQGQGLILGHQVCLRADQEFVVPNSGLVHQAPESANLCLEINRVPKTKQTNKQTSKNTVSVCPNLDSGASTWLKTCVCGILVKTTSSSRF